MIKRLYLSLMLGATTALVVACSGGGGGGNDPVPVPPPAEQPDPCAVEPKPASCVTPPPVTDKLSITSPVANSLFSKPDMSLVVKFSGGAPSDLTLKLNGKDVLASAAVSATEAVIAGADVEAQLVNGENSFEAGTGTETDKVTFLYDKLAPHIVVTSAVRATDGAVQQSPGDTLRVSGVVRDVAPITAVKINDVAATVTGGQFVAEIPFSDLYDISATDGCGQTSDLKFAAPQHTFDPMLALQVNNSLFRLLTPIINEAITHLDTSKLADPSQQIPFGNFNAAITRIDVNKSGAPAIDIHFLPSNSQKLVVGVDVSLPLVGVGLKATVKDKPAGPAADIDMDVANIDVTLQLVVFSDELNQLRVGLGSEPFTLALGKIDLNHFDVCMDQSKDCASLQALANPVLNSSLFRTLLTKLIDTAVIPSVKTALADIKVPGGKLNAPMDLNADGVQDTVLSLDIATSLFDSGAQGNGHIELAGRMYVANENLPANFKGALGSVYTDASVVPSFASTTDAGKEYDLGIALPSNFLNQAFLALYQTGAMSSIAANIKQSDLGSMSSLLGIIGVGPNDTMRMRLEMGSVPYIQLSHDDLGGSRTAGIAVHLDNTTIYMDAKKPDGTEYTVLMGMVADISANLQLGIDGQNYIDLGVDNFVDMHVVSVLPVGVANGPFASLVSPSIIESYIAPAVKGMLKTDTLPAMLKKTMDIAISMADQSQVPLQLPLDMGMIIRDLSVDTNDAYLVIKLDLLNGDEVQNSAENVPFKIDVSKRPAIVATAP